jgi:two-component system response regulator NreC
MLKQKILIAEGHTILREGLRALLSATPELEIIGEAEDGQQAVRQARLLGPHLILMALNMPTIDGTEVIRAIKYHNPEIKIIALTAHISEEYVRATLDAGAAGYVLKNDSYHDLLTAIENVQKGKTYLSPGICDIIINGFLGQSTPPATSSHSWNQLTAREREVTRLITKGKRSREIAEHISVSISTVEKHRSNLMRKLNLNSVCALTKYAIENNLFSKVADGMKTSHPATPPYFHYS